MNVNLFLLGIRERERRVRQTDPAGREETPCQTARPDPAHLDTRLPPHVLCKLHQELVRGRGVSGEKDSHRGIGEEDIKWEKYRHGYTPPHVLCQLHQELVRGRGVSGEKDSPRGIGEEDIKWEKYHHGYTSPHVLC